MEKLDKTNIRDMLALTPMQEGMLFHYLKDPGSEQYFEQLSLGITGKIDLEIFEKTWNFVIETNEMLRAVFRWEKVENPIQIILKEHRLRPKYYDFSGTGLKELKKRLEEVKVKDRKEKFDLREVPFRVILCKTGEDKYEMIISNHHILYDGWSNGIILQEFFNAYYDLYKGKDLVKPVKTRFKEFIHWVQNQDMEKQEKYWRSYLEGFDTCTELPVKRKKSTQVNNNKMYQWKWGREKTNELTGFLKKHKLTFASLLYSAWGILLQKYNNIDDVVFGTTVSGRSAKLAGIEDMVGLFINTLPLRTRNRPHETAGDLLKRMETELHLRQNYEHSSLVNIRKWSEISKGQEFFDTIVILENYPLENRLITENKGLSIYTFNMFEMTHYDLTVSVSIFDNIDVKVIYHSDLFNDESIGRLINHFAGIVERLMENPGRLTSGIEIISKEEKNKILYDLNDTQAAYPADKTIHQLFAEQAARTPDHAAIVGSWQLAVGNNVTLTYRKLNDKSNQLAHLLIGNGVQTETIVGIMVERSLEMIIGILAILKAGGAYLPISTQLPTVRKKFMINDSGVEYLLLQKPLLEPNRDLMECIPGGNIVCLDDPGLYESEGKGKTGMPVDNPEIAVGPNNPVYVIYTSGSTGKPKGVFLEHRGLVNYTLWAAREYVKDQEITFPLYTSFSFDLTVTSIFTPLITGNRIVIFSEDEKELLTREVITGNRVDIVKLTPSQLKLIREMLKDEVNALNHGQSGVVRIKRLIVGGENLAAQLAKDIHGLFQGNIEIFNEYGPTETVVGSMIYRYDPQKDRQASVPIGKPIANTQIYLWDENKKPVPIGVPGEIYISGCGVAKGYLNRPGLTGEKFIKNPYKRGGRLYKSGDLARFLESGDMEYLGRIDHQVKVRGFRIELGEIENQLLTHADVKEAVVVARSDGKGDQVLCAYVVSSFVGALKIDQVRHYLQQKLPDYMMPSYFVPMEKIPLTPNGKVHLKGLPEPEFKAGKDYVSPRNEIEKKLVKIWAEVLGKEYQSLGIDDNFFELGGHSLKATVMILKVHKKLHVNIPLAEVFNKPTIRGLAGYMKGTAEDRYAPVEVVEKKEYYPLSSAQKRLYFLQQMDEDSTAYNMPSGWILEGVLDKGRLEGTFQGLIQRHESMRTILGMVGEEPVQKVREDVEFEIEYDKSLVNCQGRGEVPSPVKVEKITRNFIRPFDLTQAPLLRVAVAKLEEEEHILMVDMHHIISDGMSAEILVQEFITFYSGEELPETSLRYKDYAQWQESQKGCDNLLKQKEYWRKEFAGEIPVLELPTDYSRPSVQQYEGSSLNFEICKETTANLRAFIWETGATLYMVLLALYSIFLSKISSQEDIVIGTPVAGRRYADLERIIGMFVNTLALRIYPSGEKKFTDFLEDVKGRTLKAFENQDHQYEDLVEEVILTRDTSRNPLFDTMFALQNNDIQELTITGLKLSPYQYKNQTAKFDLTLVGVERGDKLSFTFEYSTKLFRPETIEGFIDYFNKIVSVVSASPTIKISEIEILSGQERRQILFAFNETHASYPAAASPIQLFEAQVEKTPGKAALVSPSSFHQLTYRELNERSNRLGWLLKEKGVGGSCIVGLMVERSVEMLVGILGIMKAGGAYLPIDVDYPPERVNYMMKDSQSLLLLTRSDLAESFNLMGELIDIETACSRGENRNPGIINNPQDLVYMIYTSGSTGKPKGVMVKIEGFLNLLHWYIQEFKMGGEENVLLIAPISFDLAQKNLFCPLIGGGRLTLAAPGIPDYHELSEMIQKEQIAIVNCAPSVFYPLVEINGDSGFSKLTSLREVVLGGETIQVDKLLLWVNSASYHCEIVNTYGPTECTDIASFYRIPREIFNRQQTIPIGKPIPNVKIFILDKYLKVLPLKVPGELCIGGIGLSKGYYDNKQLTREKFVETPHLPGKRVYRTGDLTRWLPDGNIEFLGRIDQQVKVRGFRIELGEIEHELLRHEEIRDAVVTARKSRNGDNYLCGYIIAGRELEVSELREYLGRQLPDYMIPTYFVYLDQIPLTPSGKVDRRALPEPGVKEKKIGTYAAPRGPIEEKLVELWHEVLDRNTLNNAVGINDNFFQIGGHSLKAIVLVSKIHKTFGVKITIQNLFQFPTIAGMANLIKNSEITGFEKIETLPEQPVYEMSYSQKRLWLLNKLEPQNTAFNLPVKITLYEAVAESIIRKILEQWIIRHESLRTSFKEIDNETVQVIEPANHLKLNFEVMDCSQLDTVERKNRRSQLLLDESFHIFNLETGPLFRAKLVKWDEKEYDFIFNIHHIISDGWSIEILRHEFHQFYDNHKKGISYDMKPLRVQYKDYAAWHNRLLVDEEKVGKAKEFWKNYLSGTLPALDLPYDFSPGPGTLNNKKSSAYNFVIDQETTERLRSFAREQKGSLFMVLLASFNILLAHITGQEEILLAVPAAARRHWELKNIIGMFVNTMVLRAWVNMSETFIDLFRTIQADTFNVLEFQDYPLEAIFKELKMKYPEISVFFNMVNVGISQEEQLTDFNSYHIEKVQDTKFDMLCYLTEYKNAIQISCHYFSELFRPETIERIMRLFTRMLENISRDPGKKVNEYCISKKKKNVLRGLKAKLSAKEEKTGNELNIKKEVKEAQQRLSKVNIDFLQYVERNPGCFKKSNFQILELNDDLFRLQPWPTFISAKSKARFREAGVKLFNLIKQIPGRVFNHDLQKMSEYYQTPREVLDFQLEGVTQHHIDNLVGRGDFLLAPSGLKCLEYNVTPSLGGWQIPIWESLYLNTPILVRFLKEYTVKTKNENLLGLLLQHAIRCCLVKLPGNGSEMNIALVMREYKEGIEERNWMQTTGGYLKQLYKDILAQVDKSLKGEIVFCDYPDLHLADRCIFYKGMKIHGIVEAYNGQVASDVMEAFKAGNTCLFNGPITDLLSNKLNLAVLSDPVTNAVFTDEERESIDAYVPWTRKTSPGPTTYKGETIHDLEHFMLSHQEHLVIKPGHGYGGKGIRVGNKTPGNQWKKSVKTALDEKNWVVQELVESSPGVYLAGDEYKYHDMAWGFFTFGSQYTGAWVRVMPQENNKGMINCHQGASVSVIFEVDE